MHSQGRKGRQKKGVHTRLRSGGQYLWKETYLIFHSQYILEGVLINVGDLPTGLQWLAIIGYNRWAFEVSAGRGAGRRGEGGEEVLLPLFVPAHHSYIPPCFLSPPPRSVLFDRLCLSMSSEIGPCPAAQLSTPVHV